MTDHAAANETEAQVLAQLLGRLAAELERLAALAASLDGAFTTPRVARSGPLADALQDLDRLRQHCADIALFQTRLAAELRGRGPLAAEMLAEGLQLREVADRLAGRATDTCHPAPDPGEVEFF